MQRLKKIRVKNNFLNMEIEEKMWVRKILVCADIDSVMIKGDCDDD